VTKKLSPVPMFLSLAFVLRTLVDHAVASFPSEQPTVVIGIPGSTDHDAGTTFA